MMIQALDHLVVGGSPDVYETLLGRRAVAGKLRTANVGLAFVAGSSGLLSMVFATADLDRASTLLERRAVTARRDGASLALTAHGVARFKTPEQVVVWDALPKNDAGKVLKHQIRATLSKGGN